MAGKGDKRRKGEDTKAFGSGWDYYVANRDKGKRKDDERAKEGAE